MKFIFNIIKHRGDGGIIKMRIYNFIEELREKDLLISFDNTKHSPCSIKSVGEPALTNDNIFICGWAIEKDSKTANISFYSDIKLNVYINNTTILLKMFNNKYKGKYEIVSNLLKPIEKENVYVQEMKI